MFEKYLKDIGLSEKEAAVYVALLSFDKAQITEISEKAKIKRPTTYVIIESLQKKGLVSEININKKTFYMAESPENLDIFVERQIHLLEENKKALDIVIPQLKEIQREGGERPVVQFYDGKEGAISAHEDIYSQKFDDEPVYMIYSRDLVKNLFSDKEGEKMKKRRISKGIKSKVIYTSSFDEKPSDATGDRFKIDHEKYPLKSDIGVYGDKIKISIFGKRLSGISIKNKELADTIKSLVNYIFDHK